MNFLLQNKFTWTYGHFKRRDCQGEIFFYGKKYFWIGEKTTLRNSRNHQTDENSNICQVNICKVREVKIVGVMLAEKFKWKSHINPLKKDN